MAAGETRPGIRLRPTLGRHLDHAWRAAFPGLSTLLLMILSLARFNLWGQAALLPAVAMTCVWFWSLYRPASMPPPMVLFLGVMLDLLGVLPLGVGALTMLTVHGIALRLRRFLSRHGFALDWLVFCAVACGVASMNWVLVALLTFGLPQAAPAIFHAGLAIALYPLAAFPLALAHRTFSDPEVV